MKTSHALNIGLLLVNVLVFTSFINYTCGQGNGEFEGSTETGLGDNRLVNYTGDNEITFSIRVASDGSSTTVQKTAQCKLLNLPFLGCNFKGKGFTKAYVCANGLVKFDDRAYELNPRNFGTYGEQENDAACLAPYWSSVDLDYFENGQSKVFFRKYENQNDDPRGVFSKARGYGNSLWKEDLNGANYDPLWVTVITWVDLRPKQPGDATYLGRNTFQLFLATSKSNQALVVYIYKDIDWSIGVNRDMYSNWAGTSDLPVAGYNSGQKDDKEPYKNHESSGTVNVEEVDDYFDPNLLRRGEIGYSLKKMVVKPPTSAEKCFEWVNEQMFSGNTRRFCRLGCAPTLRLARFSLRGRFWALRRRFKRTDFRFIDTFCILSARWGRIDADECCYLNVWWLGYPLYSEPRPGAGYWRLYHPFRNFQKYLEEETAYENCCTKLDSTRQSCAEFYSIHPPCTSLFWRFPSIWGLMFGDPHFISLDGKNYTFNGCGWFTYFKGEMPGTNDSSLVVQVRTTRVGNVNATGFTGIAVKEGNSETVQINLNEGGGLRVHVDGNEFTQGSNATTLESGVTLSYVNNTFEVGTPLGNGVRINEAANGTFFTFVTSFLKSYENSSLGLAGKWNGKIEDDFTLPNGTVLPIDLSDSDIFHTFGEAWRVNEDEKIYQNIDDDTPAYQCPSSFVPIFLDQAINDMNETLRAEAESVCGNDVTCLFDIAATNDVAIGKSTLTEITSINNEVAEIENNLPVFKENLTVINVTLGETFTITLEAEDPDGDNIMFDVPNFPPGATYTTNGNQLTFVWHVDSPDPANITFLVQDTKNASTTLSPYIQLCRCLNGSGCFVPEASSEQTAAIKNTFLVMSCNCPLGYTGEFCETVKDFCRGHLTPPCHPLVTCANSPTGFTCGTCPQGYEGDGAICSDINECGANETVCDQKCTNTAGSYFCGCNDGFSLDLSDGKTCNDIDECAKANDCSQLCNNTIGSYNCYCRIGFLTDPDNAKSCTAKTQCDQSNPCQQICFIDPLQVGQEKCDCNLGYRLATDSTTCEDVDECATTQGNLCDQECKNTIGSYTCSCLSGYVSTGPTSCEDKNECLEDQNVCNGVGEECENIPGSFRCGCAKRLNMVRVNGTCIFKEDDNIVADLAPAPPSARQDQIDNAVQITLADYQNSNYTLDADVLFKDSVVKLLNDFCNENTLRPQDCGVEQNQLFFNEKLVKRLPGYPEDSGNNAIIKFYVDYPSTIFINKTLDKTILASIVFAELAKFEQLISLNVTLDTSVLPETPGTPTANEISNAVQLKILDFSPNQWTIFYDTVFRRSVALALNKYCSMDNYSRSQDCGLTESQSLNSSHIKRLSGSPSQSGGDVLVSFYVDHPSSSDPVLRNVLASMLVTRETDLEIALSQQVEIQTSAEPANPPVATSEQTTNSVVIRIASFGASQWTYLYDRRLRKSIAKRIAEYCSANLANCQVKSGGSASFSESDVQRSSAGTPTNAGSNNIDYSFYVTYPSESNPITKNVLASIVYLEIEAIQSESSLFFSLQTSLELPAPTSPNADQSSNTVVITILDQQANQWHSFVDNKLRAAIATQVGSFCAGNLVVCGVSSDQVSFGLSNVTRIAGSPVQDGDNVTYTFFVDYPSGNKAVQRNLLAGILAERLAQLKNATKLDISLETSTLAPKPSSTATANQISNAVNISAGNVQADKWSAIQDLTFRGYVAQAITEYCQASQARIQECELPSGQSPFTSSHVKFVNPGNPEQNGANAEIEFFVEYPGGGTVSQAILLLIMNEQLSSIQQNTGLQLTVLTTVEIVTEKPPTVDNTQNAIKVVLKDFQANQWSLRDGLFRQNMANAIKTFCARGTYHRNICNISEVVSNAFTADNIQRLPDSPTQNGTDSILSFYATLPPDGSSSLPKSVLATIFTSEQEDILSLDSELENPDESVPSSETPVLTTPQRDNLVPITIFNFKRAKFTTLVVVDIRVTVAARMNTFCFSTTENVCGLFASTSRRRKRAAGNQQFSETDVIVDANVTESGNNTVVGAVVNEPGTTTPVKTGVVEDALHQTLQENGESDISSLTLGVVNTPTVSETQENNAASVRLTNTNASQWTLQQDISFRHNMSQAIKQFCGESDARLASCNLTRAQVDQISFQHIQILPNSPTQDGNDAMLSFFVNLPDGTTMSSDLISTIYSVSRNVISQPNEIVSTSKNTNLTREETENLIQLSVEGMAQHPDDAVRLDIQVAIADRLKEYCSNNSGATICSTSRDFAKDDIVVQIDPDTRDVSFVVKDPDNSQGSPISSIDIQDAINGDFMTQSLGLNLRITRLLTENAIHVVLKNFKADEWSAQNAQFLQNMSDAIKNFCGRGNHYRTICNISEAVSNNYTTVHIKRLPNTPTQNGTDSILSFYASLPGGSGALPVSVLATIFVTEEHSILPTINSELKDPGISVPSSETPTLTPAQTNNLVPITIFNFSPKKYTTLVVVDIKVTVAARVNTFCFSTTGDICGLNSGASRRKKRAAGNQMFSENDVLLDSNVTESGSNTVVGAVVNKPGTNIPVETDVVKDALHQTLQENGESDISSLTLGVVNPPTVSETQQNNAINVTLTNTNTSQWTLQQDISFRNNMSQAIIQFCNETDARLALCGLTRAQVAQIDVQNVQILPNSPTQDGSNAVLSFFVDLPSGKTMPSELLTTIYSLSPNVISQPTTVASTSQNAQLSKNETDNLVQLTVVDASQHATDAVRLDVQLTIANRLNENCQNNSADICPKTRNFTKDDVLVQIDGTGAISFVVKDPDSPEGAPLSSSGVKEVIKGDFTSDILGLKMTVTAPTTTTETSEVDWPLILGLSIGGVLLFIFVILSIILGVVNNSSGRSKFKSYELDTPPDSIYSARGWEFERDSPYSGSPFASIDAIPGFDEDGLPSESQTRPVDTRV